MRQEEEEEEKNSNRNRRGEKKEEQEDEEAREEERKEKEEEGIAGEEEKEDVREELEHLLVPTSFSERFPQTQPSNGVPKISGKKHCTQDLYCFLMTFYELYPFLQESEGIILSFVHKQGAV